MADPKRSAVILVDMARDFVEPGGFIAEAGGPDYRARAQAIVPPLKKLVEAARRAGATVVYSTDEHTPEDLEMRKWPPHSMKGSEWSEIIKELAIQPGDLNLPKTTYSGFQSTDMESRLRSRGIDTLYITGLHTDCCCRHTSGDAFQKGFNLTIAHGTRPILIASSALQIRLWKNGQSLHHARLKLPNSDREAVLWLMEVGQGIHRNGGSFPTL
jgi:nicotinamidase-related amidase